MMSTVNDRVTVYLRAVGDAPKLRKDKYKVDSQERLAVVVDLLRKRTKSEQIFVYLKESFTPSLDEELSVLYKAFGNDGRLVINYSVVPAWG
eukprot:jgi/Botrbrau1/7508/Bobra.0095s0044.1